MSSKVVNVILPEDVLKALAEEAEKMGVSADAVASSILCDKVCVTLCSSKGEA